MATHDDSTSSSDKKTNAPTIVEEEEEETVSKPAGDKLGVHHLIAFGFNVAEEASRNPGKWDDAGGAGGGEFSKAVAAAKKTRSKNKNQNVVYGADPDDVADTDFNDQDYDDDHDDILDDDSDEDDGEQDELAEEGEEEDGEYAAEGEEWEERGPHNYFDDYLEGDDMWDDEEEEEDEDEGDEEELERLRQEAFEAAVLAAEEERERIRDLRLAEIMKKKEILIERYLRVARIMINHRKKNIYLQDYLYHLAFRKGVLRGDTQMHGSSNTFDSEESETVLNKAIKRRQQKKNATMASRFGRFLRKTGHFYDAENPDEHHRHHHRNDPAAAARSRSRIHRHHEHYGDYRNKSGHHFNEHRSRPNFGRQRHGHHDHRAGHFRKLIPATLIRKRKRSCPDAPDGKTCPLNRKTKAKVKALRKQHHHHGAGSASYKSMKSAASRRSVAEVKKARPRTLAELLEEKAAATLHVAMKTANDALDAFERHRCSMAKKKQQIKIVRLLERQYSGISVLDQERNHLVSFVETSVKAQNLAKKKALRRQQKNKTQNKTGAVNLNHQWTKSLERIRELRLKKAKLEQDHRLVLLRKVKHWHIWEKRDATAIETVYDFVTDMASRVNMSRRETLSFRQGLDQFRKQLYSLHETMIQQVVKMFKVQNMLFMAQRHVRDNTSVAAPVKGFTISDYERMIIENQESHHKLVERQEHLVEMYEKLKSYIQRVADSHLQKQRSWGALRTGRHDMKQLWILCSNERDSLLKKLSEIRKVNRLHQRLFMQISVLENRRLFKDFHQVNQRVLELKDQERDLSTQFHQTQTLLRVLNVKYLDTQERKREWEKENSEKVSKDGIECSRNTITQRLAPRAPNTIHNIHMTCAGNKKPQKDILADQRQGLGTPTMAEAKGNASGRTKLPRVSK